MEEKLIGLESIEDFEASLVADVEAPRDEDERGSEDGAALEPTVEVSPEAEVIDDIPPAGTSPTKPSKKPGQSATGKKNKKKTSVAKWIGKRLGHYRLMRLLGSGAMGVVFQAEDVNLKRIAAIKVLRRRMSGQKQGKAVKRFLLEAQTAAALDHPGIARVYEINEHQGWWYIAMEFLEGGSLHEIVRATGPLDPGRAAIMLADASRALAAAHEGGVIHRDIKPANLMLNRQGRCKLVDFGMVKLDSAENPFHDDDQQILGTPFYVAPEVIQRKGASPASDMYSLGATAYALLTNSPPYTGEKINHVIKQHLEAPVPDPCIKSPMCSRVMGDLIRRAMAKDPDARPTAEAFAAAMQSEASVALVSDTGSIIGGSAVIGMSGSGGVFGSGGLSGSGATGAGSGTSGTNVLVDPAMHRTHVIPAGGRRQRLAWWVWGLVTFFALGSVGMGLWLSQQRPIDSSEYGGFSPVKTFGGSQGADDPQAPVLANFTNGIDMRMVPIPTGRFTIGSPPSEPHRNNDERMVEVELTRTVYMGVTEVTQRQWAEVMGNDYHPPEGVHPNEASGLRFVGDALPAYVSWLEAAEFCQRLSELEERYYRLPTEAEWERACRAGTTTAFHTGQTIAVSQANIDTASDGDARSRPMPVASFQPNAWGLYDMHGNVMEWCSDWKAEYPLGPLENPVGPESGDQKVLRGGSWDSYAHVARSANRWSNYPVVRTDYTGFRVVLDPDVPRPPGQTFVADRDGVMPRQQISDRPFVMTGDLPPVDPDLPDYEPASSLGSRLRSAGSDTMDGLMMSWERRFQSWHPDIRFRHEGKGSGTAVPALVEGLSHFGPMSRPLKPSELRSFQAEFGYKPTQFRVALDALAVYVHAENPIVERGLTLEEVDAIFSATRKRGFAESIDSWSAFELEGLWSGASLRVFSRNPASGTYGVFRRQVLQGGEFKPSNLELVGSAEVVDAVANDRFAIGYSGIGYKRANIVAVPLAASMEELGQAVAPSPDSVYSGQYPLVRGLYMTINVRPGDALSPLQREFIRFVFSRQGQALVAQSGFFPLNRELALRELRSLGL